MSRAPGFTDRLCARCGTYTVHQILRRRRQWRCTGCGTLTGKDAPPPRTVAEILRARREQKQ